MSKKINSALKDLKKALEAHADVVGGSAVSLKKAQRASAKVAAAAEAYVEAVQAKSGLGSPFTQTASSGLEDSTVASLAAERDSIKQQLTGPVPILQPDAEHAEAHGEAHEEEHHAEEHHKEERPKEESNDESDDTKDTDDNNDNDNDNDDNDNNRDDRDEESKGN